MGSAWPGSFCIYKCLHPTFAYDNADCNADHHKYAHPLGDGYDYADNNPDCHADNNSDYNIDIVAVSHPDDYKHGD